MKTSEIDFLLDDIRKSCELGNIEEVILLAEKLKLINDKKDEFQLTFENINLLGFNYNHFDGFIYQHDEGFSISVYNVNEVWFKQKKYICYTNLDFQHVINQLKNQE